MPVNLPVSPGNANRQHIRFPELVNDLFGVVSFLRHGSDLLNWLFTTLDPDQEYGARSV